uniref:Uncharacterized protein n=1 Tax=Arundo donax TaxID=35708 RepID=A0A0A9D1D6_ARUDO
MLVIGLCFVVYISTREALIFLLCLFLGWLFDIGAGVCERVTTWWIGLLVGSVLFNAGALYRRKRVRVLKVLCSFPSSLDATRKRKKVLKGVQSLVKR